MASGGIVNYAAFDTVVSLARLTRPAVDGAGVLFIGGEG